MAARSPDERFPVTVVHPVPGYRLGLLTALSHAGYAPFESDDAAEWVLDQAPCAILVAAHDGEDLARLDQARGPAENTLVALLPHDDPSAYALALRAGADGAISWDSPPASIVDVLGAALNGCQLLPADVARALARGYRAEVKHSEVTEDEVRWLGLLADGRTIAELAQEAGYSIREMHRLLHDLYLRLGATNRSSGLVQATRGGLLDGWSPSPASTEAAQATGPGR
jgi:DNA-binding NarL/FixJ family response regulator